MSRAQIYGKTLNSDLKAFPLRPEFVRRVKVEASHQHELATRQRFTSREAALRYAKGIPLECFPMVKCPNGL